MVSGVELYRHTNESAALQEAGKCLRSRCGGTSRVDVKHLAAAIDHHSKFRHFVGTKQAIEMRASVSIDVAFRCNFHRNVLKCAIAHGQSRYSAHRRRLTGSLYVSDRSEERRVGKECRSRWSP